MIRDNAPSEPKPGLHPRNRHAAPYDFADLVRTCPELSKFVRAAPSGRDTIDFADSEAVSALNRALLQRHYGITDWRVPAGYLCPPIPGRADYIHHLAELLRIRHDAAVPRGPEITILDIGVGANCVYPIIGVAEYEWRFVGTDLDGAAIASARRIVAANRMLADRVEVRLQPTAQAIFEGVIRADETFAATMCNPPFHPSAAAAAAATHRKTRNLSGLRSPTPLRNFGGQGRELWCAGGEAGFIRRMITESAARPGLCRWFTSLVSKRDSLPPIYHALAAVQPTETRTIEMAHGNKKSRIVAWRFR